MMTKFFISAAIVASLLTSPVSAKPRSNKLSDYPGFAPSARADEPAPEQPRVRRQADSQPAPVQSTYRDGPTQSQVAFALQMQREAVKMCRQGNLNDDNVRMGSDILGSIIVRAVEGRGSRYSGGRRYSRYDNGQNCDELGQRVYQDALQAQPDSYCKWSSDEEFFEGGADGGVPTRRPRARRVCQQLEVNVNWNASFQPRSN